MPQPTYTFDKSRLAALESHDILDTPAEPGFDDIVLLATQICDTPVALVSLVAANRQWFKARIGFEPCETDLDSSICAHALAEPDLLVIPDLTLDDRTKANPLVTGDPFIRFYAGAPLRLPAGEVLGSLCVIDGKPRPEGLTEQQASGLMNLSRQVMTQLELRRAIADRDEAERTQEVLNQELSHRMKNVFAMVQAIATQTLRGVTEREAVGAFTQRLHALSTAHDVLLKQSWAEAQLEEVVRAVLSSLSDTGRLEISGPCVQLGPRATLSMSLLLHELATNAVKYGALSTESGKISVSWTVSGDEDSDELTFSWKESGGPPATVPTREGFGTKLIRMGLIGTGGVELSYDKSGFEAEFKAPLAQVRQS